MYLRELLSVVLVAIIWGTTNPFIKRGAEGIKLVRRHKNYHNAGWLIKSIMEAEFLLFYSPYMIPLVINLLGSLLFIYFLPNIGS